MGYRGLPEVTPPDGLLRRDRFRGPVAKPIREVDCRSEDECSAELALDQGSRSPSRPDHIEQVAFRALRLATALAIIPALFLPGMRAVAAHRVEPAPKLENQVADVPG